MDIFTIRIREAIANGSLTEERLVCNLKGQFKDLGPFSSKLQAKLSPKMREKLFGINYAKLPHLIAVHVSEPGKEGILEDNIKYLCERGLISSLPSREKLRDSIKRAWESVQESS